MLIVTIRYACAGSFLGRHFRLRRSSHRSCFPPSITRSTSGAFQSQLHFFLLFFVVGAFLLFERQQRTVVLGLGAFAATASMFSFAVESFAHS